ncbi:MAG: hypothetical protein HZC42_08295 [Candidatus Eisenbacteria bacterium]|nr:hypothetical protein [Candidatus Eisenbacteria bacterium]
MARFVVAALVAAAFAGAWGWVTHSLVVLVGIFISATAAMIDQSRAIRERILVTAVISLGFAVVNLYFHFR